MKEKRLNHIVLHPPRAMKELYFKGTKMGLKDTPSVASLLFMCSNILCPAIIKFDIVDTELNIFVAWSLSVDTKSTFNIISDISVVVEQCDGLVQCCDHIRWRMVNWKILHQQIVLYYKKNSLQAREIWSKKFKSRPNWFFRTEKKRSRPVLTGFPQKLNNEDTTKMILKNLLRWPKIRS